MEVGFPSSNTWLWEAGGLLTQSEQSWPSISSSSCSAASPPLWLLLREIITKPGSRKHSPEAQGASHLMNAFPSLLPLGPHQPTKPLYSFCICRYRGSEPLWPAQEIMASKWWRLNTHLPCAPHAFPAIPLRLQFLRGQRPSLCLSPNYCISLSDKVILKAFCQSEKPRMQKEYLIKVSFSPISSLHCYQPQRQPRLPGSWAPSEGGLDMCKGISGQDLAHAVV